eukprot:gene39717-53696_t
MAMFNHSLRSVPSAGDHGQLVDVLQQGRDRLGAAITGDGRTHQSLARLSARDAGRLDAFTGELEVIADVLRAFVLRAPPNLVAGFGARSILEAINALGTFALATAMPQLLKLGVFEHWTG